MTMSEKKMLCAQGATKQQHLQPTAPHFLIVEPTDMTYHCLRQQHQQQ